MRWLARTYFGETALSDASLDAIVRAWDGFGSAMQHHPMETNFLYFSPMNYAPAYPWKLSLLGHRVDRSSGKRSFTSFESEYWLQASALEGGRPELELPDAAWLKVWKARAPQIALFVALLLGVALVYALREQLTRRATRRNKWPVNIFKYSAWVAS